MSHPFDWTTSGPHVALLAKFRAPRPLDHIGHDYRAPALGESAPAAVQRFLAGGHLAEASLERRVAMLAVRDLKAALRRAGSKVSGKKTVLVERLLSEAPGEAENATVGLPLVHTLTKTGRELVERYRQWERERLRAAVSDVAGLLNRSDVLGAVRRHRDFEAQDPWRDPGSVYPEREHIEFLRRLAPARPSILRGIDEANLSRLRLAAALWHFFGGVGIKELPSGYSAGSHLDGETAARMVWFHVRYLENRERHLDCGVHRFHVLTCGDARTCQACQSLEGRVFTTRTLPELPYPSCTSESGCRCTIIMAES